MTIQEYIKIAVKGVPQEDFRYYMPYFLNMDCEHCIYNGYACRHPHSVCMDYRVERSHNEFKIQSNRKDIER